MATVRHRRWWASTARLWPRRSGSAARGTEREQISLVDVADASFMMPLSMEETTPAPPSTGMGSSARSCGRPRLPSSGDHGRSDCMRSRSRARGNAMRPECCAPLPQHYTTTTTPLLHLYCTTTAPLLHHHCIAGATTPTCACELELGPIRTLRGGRRHHNPTSTRQSFPCLVRSK